MIHTQVKAILLPPANIQFCDGNNFAVFRFDGDIEIEDEDIWFIWQKVMVCQGISFTITKCERKPLCLHLRGEMSHNDPEFMRELISKGWTPVPEALKIYNLSLPVDAPPAG